MNRILVIGVLVLVASCKKSPPAEVVDAGPAKLAIVPIKGCGTKEVCAEACAKNDAEACYGAAMLMFEGVGGTRDMPGAITSFAKACELGDGRGCLRSSNEPGATEEALKARVEKARGLLPRQCEQGNAEACELFGSLNPATDGAMNPMFVRAASLYQKACEANDGRACQQLGSSLMNGRLGTTNMLEGSKLLDRVCEAGLAGACAELGLAYRTGKIGNDPSKGAAYLKRAGELSRQQ